MQAVTKKCHDALNKIEAVTPFTAESEALKYRAKQLWADLSRGADPELHSAAVDALAGEIDAAFPTAVWPHEGDAPAQAPYDALNHVGGQSGVIAR